MKPDLGDQFILLKHWYMGQVIPAIGAPGEVVELNRLLDPPEIFYIDFGTGRVSFSADEIGDLIGPEEGELLPDFWAEDFIVGE